MIIPITTTTETPLTFTTMIDYRQRLPDDRLTGFLHSIDQQTDQLNALLVDQVLLAKIEAGTLRLQHEAERLARNEKVVSARDP
jgi:hypothetical protein